MRIGSGTIETLAKPATGGRIIYPQALPGGRAIIYTEIGEGAASGKIVLLDLASRISAPLRAGLGARYLATGHLVFVSGGTLSAVGFDAARFSSAAHLCRWSRAFASIRKWRRPSSPSPIPAHWCICRPSVRGER